MLYFDNSSPTGTWPGSQTELWVESFQHSNSRLNVDAMAIIKEAPVVISLYTRFNAESSVFASDAIQTRDHANEGYPRFQS